MIEQVKKELNELIGKKVFNRLTKSSKETVENFANNLNIKNSEAMFLILNDMKEPQKCKMCNNYTSLTRGPLRCREYCSSSCKNKWIYENTDVKERISKKVG